MKENIILKRLLENANSIENRKKIAFNDIDIGFQITYFELYDLVLKYSENLVKSDIVNMPVIVLNRQDINSIALLLAAMNCNCIPLIKNYDHNISKLKYKFEELETFNLAIDTVITNFNVDNKEKIFPSGFNVININDKKQKEIKNNNKSFNPNYVFMQETSGTSGTNKIVPLRNEQIFRTLKKFEECVNINDFINLSFLPFSHILGLMTTIFLNIYLCGTTHIVKPGTFKNNTNLWIELIENNKVNFTACSNYNLKQILDNVIDKNYDLSSLDTIYVGGEPIDKSLLDNFNSKFKKFNLTPNCFIPSYGMTEMCGTVCHDTGRNIIADENNVVSCGVVDKNDVDICFLNNNEIMDAKENAYGYILISSDNISVKYLNVRNDSLISYNNKNYFNTNDIGYIKNNHLFVLGKKDNLIYKDGKKYSKTQINKLIDQIKHEFNLLNYAILNFDNKIIIFQEYSNECTYNYTLIKDIYIKNIYNNLGIVIDDVILIKENVLPKTEIGKVKIKVLEENYKKGMIK